MHKLCLPSIKADVAPVKPQLLLFLLDGLFRRMLISK